MLNLPLVEDKLALRANLGYFDNDGYIDNVRLGARRISWDRTVSGRVAAAGASRRSRCGSSSLTTTSAASTAIHPTEYDMLGQERIDDFIRGDYQDRVGLTNLSMTYDFGASELTSTSSVRPRSARAVVDDGTFFLRDEVFASFMAPEDLPEMTLGSDRSRKARAFSQELRLVSKNTERWDWLVGAYWYDRTATEKYHEFVALPFPGQAQFEGVRQTVSTLLLACVGVPLKTTRSISSRPIRPRSISGRVRRDRFAPDAGAAAYRSALAAISTIGLRETFYLVDQFFGPDARDANGNARTYAAPEERVQLRSRR